MAKPIANEEKKARESRLQLAIANDDVDELHELIKEERGLLDRLSKQPFPDTPLHLAAAAGKTQVAMEMAILRPSFARKLNVEGYSPMHLALQHENYRTVRALMTIDTKLIRVQGRCGITPLHYLADKEGDDELELLAEFLSACKSSIKDLTSRCETVVHVAIKKNNLKAFKILFKWLERVHLTEILDWKDENGNTILQIAESKELTEIVILLKEHPKMQFQVNPDEDEHLAEESQPSSYNFPLSHYLRRERTVMDKCLFFFGNRNKSARDMILLVAALIATATYQAALTPPGGYLQDDSSNPLANSTAVTANSSGVSVEKLHKPGSLILSGSKLYQFTTLNTLVFSASITTIWMTAFTLLPHTMIIYGLTIILNYAYLVTLLIGFPNTDTDGARLVKFYFILMFFTLVVPILLWLIHRWKWDDKYVEWIRVRGILQ